jgi:hypothetical protein
MAFGFVKTGVQGNLLVGFFIDWNTGKAVPMQSGLLQTTTLEILAKGGVQIVSEKLAKGFISINIEEPKKMAEYKKLERIHIPAMYKQNNLIANDNIVHVTEDIVYQDKHRTMPMKLSAKKNYELISMYQDILTFRPLKPLTGDSTYIYWIGDKRSHVMIPLDIIKPEWLEGHIMFLGTWKELRDKRDDFFVSFFADWSKKFVADWSEIIIFWVDTFLEKYDPLNIWDRNAMINEIFNDPKSPIYLETLQKKSKELLFQRAKAQVAKIAGQQSPRIS